MNPMLLCSLCLCATTLFAQTALPQVKAAPAGPAVVSRPQEEGLATYRPISGLTGTLAFLGPDSMEVLVQSWITAFKKQQPGCNITYMGGLTDAAAQSLIAGGSLMAGMLREMNRNEHADFLAKWRYAPTRVWVAVNPLAVYVNNNNPILSLSVDQLDAIYSTTRRSGAKAPIETWGDLGLMRDWAIRPITPYSRDENTATRAFFQQRVMLKGDFKAKVVPAPDHASLIEKPMVDMGGIAVSSLDTPAPGTRLVPLAHVGGQKACLPTTDNVLKGDYPLARFFYIYINKSPSMPVPPLAVAFLSFVLSKEGQQIALNEHQIPVSSDIARAGLMRFQ